MEMIEEFVNQAKKQPQAYEEVICPFCAAKIWLYSKMEYGYCPFCASKVSFRAAKDKEFSKQLIDHLSGDEYYALLQNGESMDLEMIQTAVQKGSTIAAIDLGRYYVGECDYDTAMTYLKIAKDSGSSDGKAWYLLCEGMLMFQSGDVTISQAKKLLSDLNSIERSKMSEECRETVSSLCKTLEETIKKDSRAASKAAVRTSNDEDRDFQEWLARKKCCCRFYSAGICTYYSGYSTAYCKYPSNPGQCSAALNNNALIFVDK